MNPTTLASRAVLSAYAKKALRPFEIIAVIIFIVALAGVAYLISTMSAWWWLLMIVVIAYGIIGSILWLILHFTLDKLRPKQTKHQQEVVAQFVKRSEKIADIVGLTRFGLILRIVRDVAGKRKDNVLTEFTHDSKSLRLEFQAVVRSFKP